MKRIFLTVFALMMVVGCAFSVISCGDEPETLSAPVVTLEGNVAKWEANPSAQKFEISLDGALSYIENSVTSKALADGQSFKVRAIGDGEEFADSSWSNVVTYTAQNTAVTYTVTWKNGDAVLETDTGVKAGETPVYNGATPTKAADAEYTYTFKGWSPEIAPVTGDVTYAAQFDKAPIESGEEKTYTVTWKNGDVVLETDTGVKTGQTPVYDGAIPTKAADAEYTYTFKGWSPEVAPVTGDVTYVAQFDKAPIEPEEEKTYTVTWKNGDVVLETDTGVKTGQTPTYDGEAPTKAADAQYTYTFKGWSPEIAPVTGDVTYEAQFDKTVRTYTVTFMSEDGSTELYKATVDSGKDAVYDGPSLNKNPEEYEKYIFDKWVTAAGGHEAAHLTNITEDKSVYASYTAVEMIYTVIFKDWDGTVLKTVDVLSGEAAIAPQDPSLAGYTFVGWDKPFNVVDDDLIVVAQYVAIKHTVKFVLPDGSVLSEDKVENGLSAIAPSVPKAILTEKSGFMEIYAFTGWNKSFDKITEETTVTAVYTSEFKGVAIVVDVQATTNTATIYITKDKEKLLYAIEINMTYRAENGGNITVDSIEANTAGIFMVDDEKSEALEFYKNNNEKTLSIIWTDINGVAFDRIDRALTISFGTSGNVNIEQSIKIVECNAVLGYAGAEDVKQIEAVIIYR